MKRWHLHDAKAHFPELVRSAGSEGPQEITLDGKPVAVLLSADEFDRLSKASESLFAFMQKSPLRDLESLEFERDKSLTRKDSS